MHSRFSHLVAQLDEYTVPITPKIKIKIKEYLKIIKRLRRDYHNGLYASLVGLDVTFKRTLELISFIFISIFISDWFTKQV